MSCPLRSMTLGRDTDAAVDENGVAYDLRRVTWGVIVRQVKVWVEGDSYVGFARDGNDDSPITAPTASNTVYQRAGETEVYTLEGNPKSDREQWLYVYAISTSVTHAVQVSFFG